MSDQTKQMIVKMLGEPTGVAMCDSGGIARYRDGNYVGSSQGYGRNWERNQGRTVENWEQSPETTIEYYIREGEVDIDFTINVYHFLTRNLEYSPGLDEMFQAWANGRKDTHHLEDMEDFPQYLEELGYEVGGSDTVNNYNGEDALSQVLQYTYFTITDHTCPVDECEDCESEPCQISDAAYVALQIHGGADVRGGYTTPRVFSVYEDVAIFDNAKGNIVCTRDYDHNWYTDDTYNWHYQGSCGRSAGKRLEQYHGIDVDDMAEELVGWVIAEDGIELIPIIPAPGQLDLPLTVPTIAITPPAPGIIVVLADGAGTCPLCGGRLAAGF